VLVCVTGSKLWEGIKFTLRSPTLLGSSPVVTDSHVLSSTGPPFAFGPIYTPVPVRIPESYSGRQVGTLAPSA
jgi:hypothetical protein